MLNPNWWAKYIPSVKAILYLLQRFYYSMLQIQNATLLYAISLISSPFSSLQRSLQTNETVESLNEICYNFIKNTASINIQKL